MVLWGISTAQAYDFPYLTFQTASGTTTTVAVEGMTITVADGQLVVQNAEGTQTFTLSTLSKMFFTDASDATGITDTPAANEPVQVFTTGGLSMGTFDSLDKAKAALKPGVYVIKSKSKTFKIAVR